VDSDRKTFHIRSGPGRKAATISNQADCQRYGCPASPWHWASRWVLERSGLTGRETIADLGAGINPITMPVYEKFTACALLVDKYFLPEQRQTSAKLIRILADIGELPFASGSIDAVISISVLEHLTGPDRLETMREIERVLRPGGRAVFTIGNYLHAGEEAIHLMRTLPYFVKRSYHSYPPINIKAMLDAVPGLNPVDSDELECMPGFEDYNEDAIASDPLLCAYYYKDYPELALHAALEKVVVHEIGLALVKGQDLGVFV